MVTPDHLDSVRALLEGAAGIATDLESRPLFVRLLALFDRMPAEDREPVLTVLEREVAFRLLQPAHDAMVGMHVARPNPAARLYTRVVDGGPHGPYVSREKLMLAVLRAAQVIHQTLSTTADDSETWRPAVIDALVRLTPEERATLAWVHGEMIALVERAEHTAVAAAHSREMAPTAEGGAGR